MTSEIVYFVDCLVMCTEMLMIRQGQDQSLLSDLHSHK